MKGGGGEGGGRGRRGGVKMKVCLVSNSFFYAQSTSAVRSGRRYVWERTETRLVVRTACITFDGKSFHFRGTRSGSVR